jgi:hypothetical protein
MAKDRANDSKRVYQNPISHVKVHPNIDEQPSSYKRNELYQIKSKRSKVDSNRMTDEQRQKNAKLDMAETKDYNETQAGGRPLKLKP